MAKMPTARAGLGVAVVNGKIYAIGGWNGGWGALAVNEEYNPVTNTWTTKKPMPTPRRSFGIAVYQNKIYVIGGAKGTDPITGDDILCSFNEVYDTLTDTWSTRTSLPTPRRELDANVVNGKIYLIGGRMGGLQALMVGLNEVYDVASDSWTTKKPIPYPVADYASADANGKVYVIGGQCDFTPEDLNDDFNQIYDPETDTWSLGAPLPTVVYYAAAGATTGTLAPKRIYVIGGRPRYSLDGTNVTQAYDPEKDTWTYGAPMPTARFHLGVAVVNDTLYAIGGVTGLSLTYLTNNEQYTPIGYGAIKPVVSVLLPENKTYNVSSLPLTFTVDKPVSLMEYSLDGQDNVSLTGNTTLPNLSNGAHNINVYAKYTKGAIGASENIAFTVAKPEPEPQLSDPFPTLIAAITVIVAIAVVGVAFLVYFIKIRKTTGKAEK